MILNNQAKLYSDGEHLSMKQFSPQLLEFGLVTCNIFFLMALATIKSYVSLSVTSNVSLHIKTQMSDRTSSLFKHI